MISTEVLLGIIGVLSTIAAGWAYSAKRAGDARLKDAEARLRKVDADAKESEGIMAIIQKQQDHTEAQQKNIDRLYETNAQFAAFIREKERVDEDNYKLTRRTIDDNTDMVMKHVTARTKLVLDEVRDIPKRLEVLTLENTKSIAATVGGEIAAAMAREFAVKNMERSLHPFPDAEDPRWREDFIQPTLPEVNIHKETYFDDDIKLKKPCARIAPDGERVRLIEESIIGWIAVDKVENGIRCWGWLPAQFVKIGLPIAPTGA